MKPSSSQKNNAGFFYLTLKANRQAQCLLWAFFCPPFFFVICFVLVICIVLITLNQVHIWQRRLRNSDVLMSSRVFFFHLYFCWKIPQRLFAMVKGSILELFRCTYSFLSHQEPFFYLFFSFHLLFTHSKNHKIIPQLEELWHSMF